MPAPLSIDLRKRIVAAVESAEHSLRDVANRFSVNLSTIVRLLQRYRKTGSVEPKPHGDAPRRPRKLDHEAEVRLLALVRAQPDATLAELRDRLGVSCSIMAVFRTLKRNRISRKKKSQYADERESPKAQEQREAFCTKMATVPPESLIFVDETGATTAMGRMYGRGPVGERVKGSLPGGWKQVTLISSLRGSGVGPSLAFPGATDQCAFETYVEKILVPELRAGDVVVWDNLSVHKSKHAIAAIEAVGARVEPLPIYSPDYSPIEEMFSKLKSGLRTMAARTVDRVMDAMGSLLNGVTPSDALGWFGHRCTYAMKS